MGDGVVTGDKKGTEEGRWRCREMGGGGGLERGLECQWSQELWSDGILDSC